MRFSTFFLFFSLFVSCVVSLAAKPVSFVFDIPHNKLNPYLREIWADVSTPSGRTVHLPAFYAGGTYYAVRIRPDIEGVYKLVAITEGVANAKRAASLALKAVSPVEVANSPENAALYAKRLLSVRIDPKNPRRFADAAGAPFIPLGANLQWPFAIGGKQAPQSPQFYREALKTFWEAHLNWARVWMCHWAVQNLDWLPDYVGPSPVPGVLDPRVADNWDAIVDAAEASNVHLQIVLQHHGQYTTGANSNWADNPWNAANKNGFLKSPGEFFSTPDARYLTRLKYRYIVARWGYSPAIFAWELFNEVHWVDAMNSPEGRAAVIAWHREMAAAIRAFDAYKHLITSSNDDIRADITGSLDFMQMHSYSRNMIDAVRDFDPVRDFDAKPVFYGETGDDHLPDDASNKDSVALLIPQLWASLFAHGEGLPAQTWYADRLFRENKFDQISAIGRFIQRAHIAERSGSDFVPFAPAVEASDPKNLMPHVIRAGQNWHRQSPPTVRIALDGSEPPELRNIPAYIVGGSGSIADKFPNGVSFEFDFPAPMSAQLTIANVGEGGAALLATLDGDKAKPLASRSWAGKISKPDVFAFTLPAGKHTLTLENNGGQDWFEFQSLALDHEQPKIAAIGRASDDLVILWLWHRENVYAKKANTSAAVTIPLPLPAGTWRVTWWDTEKGREVSDVKGATKSITSSGGMCRLDTIPVSRHAAVILEREKAK